ncbi:MAG: formate/nitrite transporter family protein [Alistipes sp.]|nr:formate/nitrite transporter family protein [Alistipes sp.]
MAELINLTKRSLCAGLMIGCGAFAYTMTGGVVGAFLFAFGLFGVLYGNWALYTGYAGSFAWRDRKDWGRLFYILAGNWAGVMAMTLLVAVSSEATIAQANDVVSTIVADRISSEWWSVLIRAIGTGFIMEIAVRYGREKQWMTVLLGVPVFIFCGLPHCVADIFYYGVDLITAEGNATVYIIPWISAIAGNLIGCNIPRILTVK